MAHWTYALLDTALLMVAFGIGAYWKQPWLHAWRRTAVAMGIVLPFFWLWDIVATDVGQWDFTVRYTLGVTLLGLPIERYVFFVGAGLAALAIWQCLLVLRPGRAVSGYWLLLPAGMAMVVNSVWLGYPYTFAVSGVVYITCVVLALLGKRLLTTSWAIYQLVLFVLFVVFGSILTALPIVTYGAEFFSGVRIGAIPLEDFLYHFAFINLVVATYVYLGRRMVVHL